MHRLRPFVEDVLAPGPEIGTIAGAVRGETFHLSVFGEEVALETVLVMHDEQGAVAVVDGGDVVLPGGLIVTIDWEPIDDPNTMMFISQPRASAPEPGVTAEAPASWTLYFWPDGTIETAHADLGVRRRPRTVLNSMSTQPPPAEVAEADPPRAEPGG